MRCLARGESIIWIHLQRSEALTLSGNHALPALEESALGKLLGLKTWLTLSEAGRHLTVLFGEPVSEADVLRLALDGHITLSVQFVNHTTARIGTIVPLAEAEVEIIPGLLGDGPFEFRKVLQLNDEEVLTLSDRVETLAGIWDLAMLGAERIDVEHRYQVLTGGPAVDLVCLDGPLVKGEDGVFAQLASPFVQKPEGPPPRWHPDRNHHSRYYPAAGLPDDCVLVLTTKNLEAFSAALSGDAPKQRPLETRERTTLLVIIGALLRLAKLDPERPSKTAVVIESETALMGARVSARAIEEHLKKVSEAIAARSD